MIPKRKQLQHGSSTDVKQGYDDEECPEDKQVEDVTLLESTADRICADVIKSVCMSERLSDGSADINCENFPT